MKKLLLIFAIILILVAIPVTIFLVKQRQEIRQRAVPATVLYIEPVEVTKNVGDTFTLNVQIDTGQNYVAAAKIDLTFDPLYLEAVSIQPGSFLPEALLTGQVGNGTASITVGTQGATDSVHGIGTAAVLTMRALTQTQAGSPAEVTFASTSQVSAVDDQGSDVLLSTQPGKVTITGGTNASPQPSATPGNATPAPTASPHASASPGSASPTPNPSPSASPGGQVTKITLPTNGSTVAAKRPTISGTSFNNALIILTVATGQTSVITTTLYANAQGAWTYTPTVDLANGSYSITVTGDNNAGSTETATSTFTVSVGGTGGGNASPSPSATPGGVSPSPATSSPTSSATSSGVPVTGSTLPTWFLLGIALLMLISGTGAMFFR